MSSQIAVLFLLSLIYFVFSAGGLAFLYIYYGQQIDILEKELIKQTSELTAEAKAYDVTLETGGRREDEDLEDESSFEISSYHDYRDETIHCCIGNETNLKQLVGQWTRKSMDRYLGTRDSTPDVSDDPGRFGSVSDYGSFNNGNARPSALVLGKRKVSIQGDQSITRQEITTWKVLNNHKSYLNNVALNQGRLTVSVEGFYLVYSKVNFDINDAPGNGFSDSLFH